MSVTTYKFNETLGVTVGIDAEPGGTFLAHTGIARQRFNSEREAAAWLADRGYNPDGTWVGFGPHWTLEEIANHALIRPLAEKLIKERTDGSPLAEQTGRALARDASTIGGRPITAGEILRAIVDAEG